MPRIVLLLAAGVLGTYLAARLRLPGGSYLGAMLGSLFVSLLFADAQPFPPVLRSAGMVFLGISVGVAVDREALLRLRRVLPADIALVFVLIAAAAGLGWLVVLATGGSFSPSTVLLGIMPGGASGLSAAAIDVNADVAVVASMHSVRLFVVYGGLPIVLDWLTRRSRPTAGAGLNR